MPNYRYCPNCRGRATLQFYRKMALPVTGHISIGGFVSIRTRKKVQYVLYVCSQCGYLAGYVEKDYWSEI